MYEHRWGCPHKEQLQHLVAANTLFLYSSVISSQGQTEMRKDSLGAICQDFDSGARSSFILDPCRHWKLLLESRQKNKNKEAIAVQRQRWAET